MERPPLSLSEVLDEELLFLRQRRRVPDQTTPSERSKLWMFHDHDFRELPILGEQVAEDERLAEMRKERNLEANIGRYSLLHGCRAGYEFRDRFNDLAGNQELLRMLLTRDGSFGRELVARSDITRRILAIRTLRDMLLELADHETFMRLLSTDVLRTCVAGGDEVRRLLAFNDLHEAVVRHRRLLGAVIDSSILRDALQLRVHRDKLVALAGIGYDEGFFRRVWLRVRKAVIEPRKPAPIDFGDADAILRALGVKKDDIITPEAPRVMF